MLDVQRPSIPFLPPNLQPPREPHLQIYANAMILPMVLPIITVALISVLEQVHLQQEEVIEREMGGGMVVEGTHHLLCLLLGTETIELDVVVDMIEKMTGLSGTQVSRIYCLGLLESYLPLPPLMVCHFRDL